MIYTVTWYRYPHGFEGEPMQSKCKEFATVNEAIKFAHSKADKIKGIYFAGCNVVEQNGNTTYEITDCYDVFDGRTEQL